MSASVTPASLLSRDLSLGRIQAKARAHLADLVDAQFGQSLSGCQILATKNQNRALLSARGARSGLLAAAKVDIRSRSSSTSRRVPVGGRCLESAEERRLLCFRDENFSEQPSLQGSASQFQQVQRQLHQCLDEERMIHPDSRTQLNPQLARAQIPRFLPGVPGPARYNSTERQEIACGPHDEATVGSYNTAAELRNGTALAPSVCSPSHDVPIVGSYHMAVNEPMLPERVAKRIIGSYDMAFDDYRGTETVTPAPGIVGSYAMAVGVPLQTRPNPPVAVQGEFLEGPSRPKSVQIQSNVIRCPERSTNSYERALVGSYDMALNPSDAIDAGRAIVGSYHMALSPSDATAAGRAIVGSYDMALHGHIPVQRAFGLPSVPTHAHLAGSSSHPRSSLSGPSRNAVLGSYEMADTPVLPNSIQQEANGEANAMRENGTMPISRASCDMPGIPPARRPSVPELGAKSTVQFESIVQFDSDEDSEINGYSPARKSEWWAPSRKATECSFASHRSRFAPEETILLNL